MNVNNSIAIHVKSELTYSQDRLYRLVVEKIGSKEAITYKEAEALWRSQWYLMIDDDEPYRTAYDVPVGNPEDHTVTTRHVKLATDEIRERVILWLTTNLGMLIVKGYFEVIPMVKLEKLGSPEITHGATT